MGAGAICDPLWGRVAMGDDSRGFRRLAPQPRANICDPVGIGMG